MLKVIFILLGIFLVSVARSFACDNGFLPENSRTIPVNSAQALGVNETQFLEAIQEFEKVFVPYIDDEFREELVVFKSWSSGTVNAYAEKKRKKMYITVYGGLARHFAVTKDGFSLVLCHELGHHLGGAPKKMQNKWSSAEGQADYFATMKCLKKLWEDEDNLVALKDLEIPNLVIQKCQANFKDLKDQLLCQRSAMAGKSVALLFQDLEQDSIEPLFETPDPTIVDSTQEIHPYAQCRLDTYFQGALCPRNFSDVFSDRDLKEGACYLSRGDQLGIRPACWFKSRY